MAADSNTKRSKHIQLSNTRGECQRLYDFLAEGLRQLPVTEEFRHDLKLVAEELLANIINHGYGNHSEAKIDVELATDEHRVHLTFIDSGTAFNPLHHNDAAQLNDFSEGGMGLGLVKSLTDEQSYRRDRNRNVLTVTKHYNH